MNKLMNIKPVAPGLAFETWIEIERKSPPEPAGFSCFEE